MVFKSIHEGSLIEGVYYQITGGMIFFHCTNEQIKFQNICFLPKKHGNMKSFNFLVFNYKPLLPVVTIYGEWKRNSRYLLYRVIYHGFYPVCFTNSLPLIATKRRSQTPIYLCVCPSVGLFIRDSICQWRRIVIRTRWWTYVSKKIRRAAKIYHCSLICLWSKFCFQLIFKYSKEA